MNVDTVLKDIKDYMSRTNVKWGHVTFRINYQEGKLRNMQMSNEESKKYD